MRLTAVLMITVAGLALAGCEMRQANDQAAAEPAATTATETPPAGVAREEVAPPPEPVAVTPPPAIQTQPGPKGATVSLNKVAVTGDILTVALTYSGTSCCAYAKLSEVSVIDDATSQRISVLKDNAGNYMAAPLNGDGKELIIRDKVTQVWFKFPAPPPTSPTVSITIPEVAPFDAVPVTR